MAIPEFDNQGRLPPGIHQCTGNEFISRFCAEGVRSEYVKTMREVFDYAGSRNIGRVFVGGSFVTSADNPRDIDIVIACRDRNDIPSRVERLELTGRRLDVMFASEDDPNILDAYINLLSRGRFNDARGVVEVSIDEHGERWQITHSHEDDDYEVIRRAYIDREVIDLEEPTGLLITVHGILSNGGWNTHVAPVASSQGWIVAPFFYGFEWPTVMFCPKRRRQIVDEFREWLNMVSHNYGSNADGHIEVSAIAHSFGTYLLGAYIDGFDDPPVAFDSIILAGCILSEDFDWNSCAGRKVGKVRNEVAPNDPIARWMKARSFVPFGRDKLFGLASSKKFSQECSILEQPENEIFDHNNVIRQDVLRTQWMPFLNANKGALKAEMIRRLHQNPGE